MTAVIEKAAGPELAPGPRPGTQFAGRRRPGETLIRMVLRLAALLTMVTTVGILIALLIPSLSFFAEVPVWEFLFGTRWAPRFADASFGAIPLITATLWTTVIALLVAVPFGLGAAIMLAEYAKPRTRSILKPVLEVLAGVPTVVYGFFALQFVQATVLREWLQLPTGAFSVLAAGLVMGVMIIPTIASISEDAMSAVPSALRQGSAALGANRMQTTLRVVFPAALSGIVAAVVLGVSRAVGETMIVAIAAGSQARIVTNPLEQGQTMTGFIANAALGDSRVGSLEYNTLFAVGLLLFLITLLMNMISIRFVRRFREAY
ncbi:phosphate ABC transporter permease subunit PstC [Microbacterium sp. zg.Y625]|uniref:phosphate ABC transporter permease subunit PstC n=1 Tax=Microbacterium jiangjiandongii TaxID=3049071 RepID=UPI00214B084A|nr:MULTISPECIES: phosphate ABC transporter permease subunit PstC [unclassified Microbacterium]MCR2792408.1 phosphate ABC transporter permease subunit PstC [Microbacterium sp. zg.Y625]MCR2816896.1 phosphate ABC transporter permease subunit PstC [Microbacterium sp. zg.Y843]WIM26404.1 phosphate ABC transporter permease subunit PstC [Microbacterium sp. zg-Y625]